MIPSAYMVAARFVLVVLVLFLAAGAGAAVNGWRLGVVHSEYKVAAAAQIGELTLAIEKQNSAIEQMRTATDAANTARQRAEKEAIAQREAAKRRDDWIGRLQGGCADNIKEAWGRL